MLGALTLQKTKSPNRAWCLAGRYHEKNGMDSREENQEECLGQTNKARGSFFFSQARMVFQGRICLTLLLTKKGNHILLFSQKRGFREISALPIGELIF